jgi:hypothetical protein
LEATLPTYVEYQLDENSTILIQIPDEEVSGVVRASRGVGEIATVKAQKKFSDALKDIKAQAKLLLKEIEGLHVEEADVKFGINTIGELGNMAIGKVGVGVNYEVTLKWKRPVSDK